MFRLTLAELIIFEVDIQDTSTEVYVVQIQNFKFKFSWDFDAYLLRYKTFHKAINQSLFPVL